MNLAIFRHNWLHEQNLSKYSISLIFTYSHNNSTVNIFTFEAFSQCDSPKVYCISSSLLFIESKMQLKNLKKSGLVDILNWKKYTFLILLTATQLPSIAVRYKFPSMPMHSPPLLGLLEYVSIRLSNSVSVKF